MMQSCSWLSYGFECDYPPRLNEDKREPPVITDSTEAWRKLCRQNNNKLELRKVIDILTKLHKEHFLRASPVIVLKIILALSQSCRCHSEVGTVGCLLGWGAQATKKPGARKGRGRTCTQIVLTPKSLFPSSCHG